MFANIMVALIGMLVSQNATAQQTNTSSRLDYSSFKAITDRNIFNANRSGRTARSREPQRQVKVDSFALVGTLSYEKGSFAFFDGSTSQFRKTLQPQGGIAGFKIADIGRDTVKLEADGKSIEMRVGYQMRREDEGEWKLSSRAEPYSSSTRSTGSASNTTSNEAVKTSSTSGEESDALKRLMQQREQE
jgi:hypothetical protein